MMISFIRFCFYASVTFFTLGIVALFFVDPAAVEAGIAVFVIILNLIIALASIFVIRRLYQKENNKE